MALLVSPSLRSVKVGDGDSSLHPVFYHHPPHHREYPEGQRSLIHPTAQVRGWHRAGASRCWLHRFARKDGRLLPLQPA